MPGLFEWLANVLGTPERADPPRDAAPAEQLPAVETLQGQIPGVSRALVTKLLGLAAEIEGGLKDPLSTAARIEVVQTRSVHLPRLLQSYVDIPPSHRADIFRRTGKSASFVLNEALERMITRLETIARSLAQDDIEAFTTNLRFIEERYGRSDPFA